MYKLDEVHTVHLEITNKCQAKCPMCGRRPGGGHLNPYMELTEITLNHFIKWFDKPLLERLHKLYMCGNHGDPIIATDTVDIFEYIRKINSKIELNIHTNGSARDNEFWEKLARLGVEVTFAIDGLADTHSLYRIGTNFDMIMRNAKTFIEAGGKADWHMLAFEHNEHQIDECKRLSKELGFHTFIVKHTARFPVEKMPVIDDLGKPVYYIKPTQKSKTIMALSKNTIPKDHVDIKCKVQKESQLYVSAMGDVSPCCWLSLKDHCAGHTKDTRVDYMDKIGAWPNLNDNSFIEIFDSGYFDKIADTWKTDPLIECKRQCGDFDRFKSQFK